MNLMIKRIICILFVLMFISLGIVQALPFTPQGDIWLRNRYGIVNATNITSSLYCNLDYSSCYTLADLASGGGGNSTNYTAGNGLNLSGSTFGVATSQSFTWDGQHIFNSMMRMASNLFHVDDLDTYLGYDPDRVVINAGGNLHIDARNGTYTRILNPQSTNWSNITITTNQITNYSFVPDTQKTCSGPYLYNDSTTCYYNDSFANATYNGLFYNQSTSDGKYVQVSWANVTYDAEWNTQGEVETIWSVTLSTDAEVTNALDNATIIRRGNTSWITTNQLFNTTTEIWAIANNGTLTRLDQLDNATIIRRGNTSWITTNQLLYNNCSANQSCGLVVYQDDVIDCNKINFSGTVGAAGICDGSDAVGGGAGTQLEGKYYLYNDTTYMYLNESVLNQTIGTLMLNGTLVKQHELDNSTIIRTGNTSWIRTNQLHNTSTEIQAVAVGGEVTGTIGSITLGNDALDDQYVELGDSFVGDVTGPYSATVISAAFTTDAELQNSTIIRTANTSWIVANQVHNTSTEIWAIANNGTLVRQFEFENSTIIRRGNSTWVWGIINNNTFVERNTWTTHDNYPSGCSAGQYVSTIGDTLTCATPYYVGNCSANQSCGLVVYEDDVIDCNKINFSGTVGAAGICDGTDASGAGGGGIATIQSLNESFINVVNGTITNLTINFTGFDGRYTQVSWSNITYDAEWDTQGEVETIWGVTLATDSEIKNNCSVTNSCVNVVYSNNQSFVRNNQLFNTSAEIKAAQNYWNNTDINVTRLYVNNNITLYSFRTCTLKTDTDGNVTCSTDIDTYNSTTDIQAVAVGGETSGTVGNIVISSAYTKDTELDNTTIIRLQNISWFWDKVTNRTLQPNITKQTCTGTEKFSSFNDGVFTCSADESGVGGGASLAGSPLFLYNDTAFIYFNTSAFNETYNRHFYNQSASDGRYAQVAWSNITYDSEWDTQAEVETIWSVALTTDLELDNVSIIRRWNTSWIQSNQLFNTSTEVWAIANNGTLVRQYEFENSTIIRRGNTSWAWGVINNNTFVERNTWTTIDNYPTGCSAGQYVSTIGDTLTCAVPYYVNNCSATNSCVNVVYSNNQSFVRNNQLHNTSAEIQAVSVGGDLGGTVGAATVDNTKCTGTQDYLDGAGNCDTIDQLGDLSNNINLIANATDARLANLNVTYNLSYGPLYCYTNSSCWVCVHLISGSREEQC